MVKYETRPPIPFELTPSSSAPAPRTAPAAPGAPPRFTSAAQSARAKAGDTGEAIMTAHHAVCLAARVADMHKLATPMVKRAKPYMLSMPGQRPVRVWPCVHGARAGVDFRGHMLDGTGRAVYVEAKFVTDPTEKFYTRAIRDSQHEQLERALAANCVAVLAIIRAGHTYAIPWGTARALVSLGDAELQAWWVRAGDPYLARWSQ